MLTLQNVLAMYFLSWAPGTSSSAGPQSAGPNEPPVS